MRFSALFAALLAPSVVLSESPPEPEAPKKIPILKLPYGWWEASGESKGVWTFANIPYAAPPVGDLRWAKPQPPLKRDRLQPGNRNGNACLQAGLYQRNLMGPEDGTIFGQAINAASGSITAIPKGKPLDESEDCLFLDVQVPEKAVTNSSLKLPVVVWVHGGSFSAGSKDFLQPSFPLYDGSPLIRESGGEVIFVRFNYRLGAMGFLAGTTMEKGGLPNAGLWDQRAAFQWVRDHIHLLGGDPNRVTAFGHDAGAASILFHLVAKGGTLDPLFERAILLSPAYQPMWDRAGAIENTFQQFATLAGCKGRGLKCLRAAEVDTLRHANGGLLGQQIPGTFAVGAAPDGSFIRQSPTAELWLGAAWPVKGLIMSYARHEARVFVNGYKNVTTGVDRFVDAILPESEFTEGFRERVIKDTYPPPGTEGGKYSDARVRLDDMIRDSSMVCNTRWLTEHYGQDSVWLSQYNVEPGLMYTNLFAVFWNEVGYGLWQIADFIRWAVDRGLYNGLFMRGLSRAYQTYLHSFIRTGDPNASRLSRWDNRPYPGTEYWRHPWVVKDEDDKDGIIKHVLDVRWDLFKFFDPFDSNKLPKDKCDFWRRFTLSATVAGMYVPDGEWLNNTWTDTLDPSARYRGGNKAPA